MRLPPVIAFVALACLAAAVRTLLVLARPARRSVPTDRPERADRLGYLLLMVGAAVTALVAITLAVAFLVQPEMPIRRPPRMELATLIGTGFGLSAAVLVAGLLFLPAVAGSAGVRLRRLLDGAMVGASLVFLLWVLVASPRDQLRGTLVEFCYNAAVPAGLALMVACVLAQSVLWAAPPRGGVALAAAGTTLVISGGAGVAGALCYGHWLALGCFGTACAVGLLLVGSGAADRAWVPAPDGTGAGQAVPLPIFAVLAMGLAACYAIVVQGGHPDAGWVVTGIIGGSALLGRLTLAVHDVRRANARLALSEAYYRELAHTDPLTGLANRRGLLEVLERTVVGGPPCVLLALDLDGFKNINDMRGHDVGDEVLAEVGRRLRSRLRPGDTAARLGGDEFAVLMWTRPAEAQRVARALLEAISCPYQAAKGTIFLSASAGLASSTSADSVARLLRNADLALRYAKLRGKARIELYEPTYEVALRRRTTVEHELRGAIERGELHIAFQPVVSLPSVRPVGAEALLRWHHPALGQVTPDEFIPIAEESGLILGLGEWVLHRACHQLSRWLADGHDVWVSVNVSVRELHAPGYLDRVAEVLRTHRVPAQRLMLEVTEQDVALDIDELAARLGELRRMGVRVALDDFGAGYSSLGQLHRLPVDILKTDRGLLAEPAPGPGISPAPIVQVAVSLGQRLGVTVIAEGVEEVAQRRLLEQAGCPYAQGILFGRGMPAEHVEAMLAAAAPPLLLPPAAAPPAAAPAAPVSPAPAPHARARPPRTLARPLRRAQNVGPVDSAHEMRQA